VSETPIEGGLEVWQEEPRGGYPDVSFLGLDGRERLEVFRRRLAPPPPLFHLTGSIPTGFGAGTADATMPATPWLTNSAGVIGGGVLAVLADIAFGCSLQTELPAATPYTTAELSMTFLRPVHPGPELLASGQAIHAGRTVGLSEAFVLAGERLLAHGSSRLSILPARDDIPPPPDDMPAIAPERHDTPDPYLREVRGEVLPQELWERLSGLEVIQGQVAGEIALPPVSRLTGLRPTEAKEGSASMALPLTGWLTSPARTVQGGITAMLADATMMCAAVTTAPAGTTIAGLDLKVNYLRPVFADGSELTAHAEVVHRGRMIAILRSEVTNSEGKRVAIATASAMYLPDRPASLGEEELGEDRPTGGIADR
jgi:uncharacterized protein (TIGR00369 family)